MQFSYIIYIISDDCEDKKNILSSDPVIGSQSTSERNTRGKYAVKVSTQSIIPLAATVYWLPQRCDNDTEI